MAIPCPERTKCGHKAKQEKKEQTRREIRNDHIAPDSVWYTLVTPPKHRSTGNPNAYHGFSPKDFGQFRMGQRQRPQPQVGRGVGDETEDKFNGFDDLMDHQIGKSFFVRVATW